MRLIYIDDSKDQSTSCFSALSIADRDWNPAFDDIKSFRRSLKTSDGILLRKELHATDFVAGRGRISDRIVTKYRRSQIFAEALGFVARLPGIQIFNACVKKSDEDRAFEWLLNRINTNLSKSGEFGIIFCDEGKDYTKLLRKMRVYNPIPSGFGRWPGGQSSRNIAIDRILEDIVYKDSASSYFIQLADFCAFALLRREAPLESRTKYGIDKAFDLLKPVLVTQANRRDPDGIVR